MRHNPNNNNDVQLFLILHNIRSAYNVGSIFRTADAAGVEKVFLCGYTPQPKNFQNHESRIMNQGEDKIAKTALGAEKTVPWEHYPQTWRLLKELKEPSFAKASEGKEEMRIVQPITTNRALINMAVIILVIFVSVLIYKTNILPAKANYATTRAIVRGWASDFNGALAKYKEALSYDVPGKYEYRHRLAQYLVGGGGPSTKEKVVREAYEYAITEVDKNIKENSIDYLPYLYASRLNIILGKDDPGSPYNNKALNYSMKALELSPTFIRTYYEIAQAYLNKKDLPKAVEFFQRAADLNPETGISYWYLGVTKIEAGDLSGVKDMEKALVAKNRYSPSEQDFSRLINIYLKTNDFARIAGVYEKIIVINPTNPQHYASLATAYVNLGRIDDAVAMARKAVQVDPSFEADARAFLKTLGREL